MRIINICNDHFPKEADNRDYTARKNCSGSKHTGKKNLPTQKKEPPLAHPALHCLLRRRTDKQLSPQQYG
ncbi:hypothetical protein [Propionivibrio limicola]|uniref:hypothetical protein n=1 Tax=Propionivibrio limicola TaxID=167645 RepID=UPI001291289D|nr:hypothetical protein [Propionivibrio limicola]